jgi:arsenate reductase
VYWEIEDPAAVEGTEEQKMEKFREIRDVIEKKGHSFLKKAQNYTEIASKKNFLD